MLAIAASDNVIRLVDPATGDELATFDAADRHLLSALCFSPKGSYLAATTENHTIQLWNLRTIRGNLAKDEQRDSSAGAATSAPSALPGPVDEKSWRRIHGTVSSVSGATLSLKADDGRAISVDMKEVGEAIRQSLSAGDKVTVVGFYRGDQNTVAARFVQKDSSAK